MDPRRNNQVANDTYDLFILLANADPNDPEDAAMILHRTGNEIYGLSLLNRFSNRPRFRRVWILQEIALAKTATVIRSIWTQVDELGSAYEGCRCSQQTPAGQE